MSGCAGDRPAAIDLSPASWPDGELERYQKLNGSFGAPKQYLETEHGMVVGTTGALAVRSGVEALRQGGSAADAAVTTALAQICLNAGSIVSYAGIMTMVYYDAGSGEVSSMNAGWNAPLEESEPLSIPFMGTPSGRQVLVPGFMAGVEAAHQRFGRLPFADLFQPAIYFAESGFEVTPLVHGLMMGYKALIDSSPGMTEVFSKVGGTPYQIGERFSQPQAAATLRGVAEDGAEYMYSGPWARAAVRAVSERGGTLSLEDLGRYQVTWTAPYHTQYRSYDVHALGAPATGGANLITALNLAELADLRQYDHWTRSPDSLYRLIQISRAARMIPIQGSGQVEGAASHEIVRRYLGIDDFSAANVTGKETGKKLWGLVQGPAWGDFKRDVYEESLTRGEAIEEVLKSFRRDAGEATRADEPAGHSDAVVAVDSQGNVAAVVHTINSGAWGTGIVVGGVALGNSAAFQQRLIQEVGPGGRIPDPTNPLIVLEGGRPVLGASCIGGGLHEAMLQTVLNVLDFGMDPKTAVETPHFMPPVMLPSGSHKQTVAEGTFPPEVLEAVRAMGQELEVVPAQRLALEPGFWIGIAVDPETGRMTGGVPPGLNGVAEGF